MLTSLHQRDINHPLSYSLHQALSAPGSNLPVPAASLLLLLVAVSACVSSVSVTGVRALRTAAAQVKP